MGRLFRVAAGLVVLAHFFALATDGLRSGFMPDDMMNLYGYWSRPAHRLAADLFNPLSASYRPAGAMFYAPLFALFGLEPQPFRIVCFLLLLANLVLAFALARRLTGSFEAAILTALVFSYHAHFSDIYFSSATIYDLLACFFCYCCLLLYLNVRGRSELIGWPACAALCTLFWLGLNSKEIAVTLPAVLLACELVQAPGGPLPSGWVHRLAGSMRCIALMASLGVLYLIPRVTGSAAITSYPAYHPTFSWDTYLDNLRHYLSLLLYRPERLSAVAALAVCAGALAAALLARNRVLVLAWLLFMVASLPVMFIAQRGAFVMYVPFLGLAMYVAMPLARAAAAAVGKLCRGRIEPRAIGLLGLAGLTAAAVLSYAAHVAHKPLAGGWVPREEAKIRQVLETASQQRPTLPPGARVLLQGDPFTEDDWAPVLALRLYYRDASLQVDRIPAGAALPGEAQKAYDAVLLIQ